MASTTFTKQPADILDFDISYADWLADRSDTISTVAVTASDGITLGDGSNGASAPSHLNGVVKFWVIGGTTNQIYKVTCNVTTAGGRLKQAEVNIRVREL